MFSPPWDEDLRINSLNNFQVCHTAVFTVVVKLYVTSEIALLSRAELPQISAVVI